MIDFLSKLLRNRVLWAGIGAWLTAQVLKTIIHAIISKRIDFSRLVGDGGMPSGHSATVTAVATMCGLVYGADSAIFAVSAILAIITCHDAMHARHQIGEHAALLNKLMNDISAGESPEVVLEEFVGHTPFQVGAGILLGILVGILMYIWAV